MNKRLIVLLLGLCTMLKDPLLGQSFSTGNWYRLRTVFRPTTSLTMIDGTAKRFIELQYSSASIAQYWSFVNAGNGYYRIINRELGDGYSLGISFENGYSIKLMPNSDNADQFWKIIDKGNGSYGVSNYSQGDGKSLGILNDGVYSTVIFGDTDNSSTLSWTLDPLTDAPVLSKPFVQGPINWIRVCEQNEAVTFSVLVDVAYGAKGAYYYKYGVSGTVSFTDQDFGDPIPGETKAAFYRLSEGAPIPPPPPPTPVTNIKNDPLPGKDQHTLLINKILGDGYALNYSLSSRSLVFQNANSNWIIWPMGAAHWESRNASNAGLPVYGSDGSTRTGYVWRGDDNAIYKIYVLINGGYWALGCKEGVPLLQEKDERDRYQLWKIERLGDDGYYQIANMGLLEAGSAYAYLFCDGDNKKLFMTGWDNAKSFNGRWSFVPNGAVTFNEGDDPMNNAQVCLTSAEKNLPICFKYIQETDFNQTPYLMTCDDRSAHMFFRKTITGQYLIGVWPDPQSKKWEYLTNYDLNPQPDELDPASPDERFLFTITKLGERFYRISNGTHSMELITYVKMPFIQMKDTQNKIEQYWYFQ